jgi:hypothetical protein
VEGYERVGTAPECVTTCVALPGEWCDVQADCKTECQDNPVLETRPCLQGSYCPGGRGADKYPCEASSFFYCPAECAIKIGEACPQGFACAGGQEDKKECVVDSGTYCPAGKLSKVRMQ